MSAFGIFALILTTAYIIYFAVTISRDVIAGRKKAEDSPESETFEISSSAQEETEASTPTQKETLPHEESVAVVETEDGGFIVGDIDLDDMLEPITIPTGNSHLTPISMTDDERNEQTIEEAQPVENEIDNIKIGFEDNSNKIEHEMSATSDQFEEYLLNQQSNSNSHLVTKIEVEAEETVIAEADDGPELQAEQEVEESEERDRM